MTYEPQPIDTSKVVLPAALQAVTELLARNAHENWAKQRIGEGWRYGPKRDDANWLKHTMAHRKGDEIVLDYKPVTITKYPPQERKY